MTTTQTELPEALDEIRRAIQGQGWRLESVLTFTHGTGVQVYARTGVGSRHVKVGPILFPPDGGTVADVLALLGSLADAES